MTPGTDGSTDDAVAPPPPEAASIVFGEHVEQMVKYAGALASTGVSHGLIGPRERPRLWERHLLNCGVVAPLLPEGASVVDVGSGAGLPGVVLAIARPDVQLTLVEPMLRRVTWLESVITDLGLANVTVVRGRAEELRGTIEAAVVTARAVARLETLAQWSLPLVAPGGSLLALKGESAQAELDADWRKVQRYGGVRVQVHTLGGEVLAVPTRVVEVEVGDQRRPARGKKR